MKLLLDTHIFLWFISKDKRLKNEFCQAIRDPNNQIYLSVVSLWECIIKYQLGKLPLPESPEIYIPKQRRNHRIASLNVEEASIIQLINLPPLHRDPFDRLLICQAIEHQLSLMTEDPAILAYPNVNLFS